MQVKERMGTVMWMRARNEVAGYDSVASFIA